jgi:CheY-like chemotaxis protein
MTRPLSVLLAEDDDPLRSVLLELLRSRGFVVHATARGDEAVELARRVEIDFSLLDLHLPGLDGVEVFRRIAREIRPLPAILMSGEATAEEARRALELGIVEFLRKPLLRRSLDQLVRMHLGRPSSSLPVRLEDLRLLHWIQARRRPPTPDG